MSDNLDEYYDFSIIRKCITTMFNDVKLESFCFDYYHDQVFEDISRGMRKTEKITLLMAHCRTLPDRMEELLVRLKKKDEYIFKNFEKTIRKKKRNKKILIDTILEWKVLHHNSQALLQEVDNVLEAFANYSLNPSLDLISDAGLTWQENFVDQCTKLKFYIEHIKELEIFNKNMDNYHQVVHQMMGDFDDQDFEEIRKWFLNLKQALWEILKISDDRIRETTQALRPN